MKILVTGASGFIGAPLCHQLADADHDVVAIYRNADRLEALKHPRITPFQADIASPTLLRQAIDQCDGCFHLAAIAKPWSPNPSEFKKTNIEGTRNVLAAALDANVKRVVFTSTASVFGPANKECPVTERSPLADQLDTDYERSKHSCEAIVSEFRNNGLDVVNTYPSRVFGPGPDNASNSLTQIFSRFASGRWRIIPGNGNAVGNYVFIDDVVKGLHLAMLDSESNENYLLCGENLNFNQMVVHLQEATGSRQRMIRVPALLLDIFARSQLAKTRLTGHPPMITPAFVKKYLKNWYVECDKAKSELGYSPNTFALGLKNTLASFAPQYAR